MKPQMMAAKTKLEALLEQYEPTAGMYVRVHGDHLILGRKESVPGTPRTENEGRVRLTRLNGSNYGLSVRRHTGRWERTAFSGSMKDMVDAILGFMQHLVAEY